MSGLKGWERASELAAYWKEQAEAAEARVEGLQRKLSVCVDVQNMNQQTYWQMTEHYQKKLTETEARVEELKATLRNIRQAARDQFRDEQESGWISASWVADRCQVALTHEEEA